MEIGVGSLNAPLDGNATQEPHKDAQWRLREFRDWMTNQKRSGKLGFWVRCFADSHMLTNAFLTLDRALEPTVSNKRLLRQKMCGRYSTYAVLRNELDVDDSHEPIEDLVTGPALPHAFRANFVTWSFYILVFVLAPGMERVDVGIAVAPQGRELYFFIICLFVYLLLSLYFEVKAAMHVLPAQGTSVGGSLNSCGNFSCWFTCMVLISAVCHVDIYTTSVFAARVLKSAYMCDLLETRWQEVVDHSYLASFPRFPFHGLVLLGWVIMFLQLVYALLFSVPISPNFSIRSSDDIVEDIEDSPVTYEQVEDLNDAAEYDVLWKASTSHGRALQALAESGRMMTVCWLDNTYLEKASAHWALPTIAAEMRRTNMRFIFFCLQSIIIPNCQITFLGIQHSVLSEMRVGVAEETAGSAPFFSEWLTDWLTTLSFVLTSVTGISSVWAEYSTMTMHRAHVREAHARAQVAESRPDVQHRIRLRYERRMTLKKIRFSFCFNRCIAALFVFFYVYLAIKAVMILTQCDSGAWNMPWDVIAQGEFNLSQGCLVADFQDFNMTGCSSNWTLVNKTWTYLKPFVQPLAGDAS